jgi:23S rRNA (cytosine1962-C5)-methyltransferase
MKVLVAPNWRDYELIDSGNKQRLERFGPYTLVRPDPQAIWRPRLANSQWQMADAFFVLAGKSTTEPARSATALAGGRGEWEFNKQMPRKWPIEWNKLKFWVTLSPFKHTGVFPEQAIWWEYIAQKIRRPENQIDQIKSDKSEFLQGGEKRGVFGVSNDTDAQRVQDSSQDAVLSRHPLDDEHRAASRQDPALKPHILNLFGYTGVASLAAAAAGAKVTHVEASYPTIGQFKENIKASGLEKAEIRYILDDCLKFVEREIKRGAKYDGIIMDPPIYGHGPKGERWEFNESFPKLMAACRQILSDDPLFVIVNAYAISASAIMLENVMKDYLGDLDGSIEVGELALQESQGGRLLSTGIFAKWSK